MAVNVLRVVRGVRDGNRHPRADEIERFVQQRGHALMRAARAHASCAADADDAYQRTLEVMLTKAPETDDVERLLAWAMVVTRNEARTQHRRRAKISPDSFEEISEGLLDTSGTPDERIVDDESLKLGKEALSRLNPDQTRCLILRADGIGYDEICERTGFSYTKVNRLLSDGRRALRDRVAQIESGGECRRLEGALSMLADDEPMREETRRDVELHLPNCLICQSTLREYREAPRGVAALMPIGVAMVSPSSDGGIVSRIGDVLHSALTSITGRAGEFSVGHQATEVTLAKKVVVASAITASLVGGGAALESVVGGTSTRDQPAPTIGPLPTAPTVAPEGPTGASGVGQSDETYQSDEDRELRESDVINPRSGRPAIERETAPSDGPDADIAPAPQEALPPSINDGGGSDGEVGGLAP